MIQHLARKIFGSKNDRELKKIEPIVARINELEKEIQVLSDDQLRQKTPYFREKLAKGATLNDILPEAFAVAREASKRVLKMRHFDVQLVGGAVLHSGKIAEMKTGEGKTLVATLPVYLNALEGKGVHVITVNDYLAKRDSAWMGMLYRFLGLSVGVIVHGLNDAQRQTMYACDITYGTNNEFGFDYLRDNMKFTLDSFVQRELNYAIVDEVDSILIDESRTPLIISGQAERSVDKYYQVDKVIPHLIKGEIIEDRDKKTMTGDYVVDEKARNAMLTEEGVGKVEKLLGVSNLYEPQFIELLHHVNQALRAHALYKRDVEYVVKEGKVIIVDEFTGRLMPGRRWSDGLHQAVEAKEGVEIENENQTLATITFQNYFRMYKKLAGMTGTADTEAQEFAKIYNLDVAVIPPNKPMSRKDSADVIYKTENEKYNCVVNDIKELNKKGRPVLVGTISIEKSEKISHLLHKAGVRHNVLNAKQHESEAEIVAQAGRVNAVSICTNMAGRGTDILLGGNPEFLAKRDVDKEKEPERYAQVLADYERACEAEKKKVIALGGLHIMGTERHESRRIDNQLRGRAGRQGDPGSSSFYLSLEDDLLRIFGSDRIKGMMDRLGIEENETITHPWISKAIENAQKRVEGHHFEIRKHLLEYDDVMNQQRQRVYGMRKEILNGSPTSSTKDKVLDMLDEMVTELVVESLPEKINHSEVNVSVIEEKVFKIFDVQIDWKKLGVSEWTQDSVGHALYQHLSAIYEEKEKQFSSPILRQAESVILLSTLDQLWKDHLLSMDHLREGIGLRGYGQKDPLLEYKKEGFDIFLDMLHQYREDSLLKLFHVQIVEEKQAAQVQRAANPQSVTQGPMSSPKMEVPDIKARIAARNDPCHCGSGKKYKKCCGRDNSFEANMNYD